MSKIGKMPIEVKNGVEFRMDGNKVVVKGPKGELSWVVPDSVKVDLVEEEGKKYIFVKGDESAKNMRGLTRALLNNMVIGVSDGYEKKLVVVGVGYGAKLAGDKIELSLGFSHKVYYEIPKDVSVAIDKDAQGNSVIVISGIDKQRVGQVAAQIRELKKPDAYKGKGIRYIDEELKLKPGKSGA